MGGRAGEVQIQSEGAGRYKADAMRSLEPGFNSARTSLVDAAQTHRGRRSSISCIGRRSGGIFGQPGSVRAIGRGPGSLGGASSFTKAALAWVAGRAATVRLRRLRRPSSGLHRMRRRRAYGNR